LIDGHKTLNEEDFEENTRFIGQSINRPQEKSLQQHTPSLFRPLLAFCVLSLSVLKKDLLGLK
jgi:hypothetical protein